RSDGAYFLYLPSNNKRRMAMLKWARKILLALFILVSLFVVILIIFAGRLAEWAVERYDEEWTGRSIEVDKIRINVFTGAVSIDGLTVFEPARRDTFFHRSEERRVGKERRARRPEHK